MRKIIIACQTIKPELSLAMKTTGVDYPVEYIESGLHNYPNLLKSKLQEAIQQAQNVDTILLAFGFCGNSLLGLTSPRASLVIPRADDCISLLLGSYKIRQKISKEMGTYFLTKGWLDNEQNILSDYERCISRYGSAKAAMVFKKMLNHYKRLMVIDTQTYDLDEVIDSTESFAAEMGIVHDKVNGSLRFLNKLLLGPWDSEFIILKPEEIVTLEHLSL